MAATAQRISPTLGDRLTSLVRPGWAAHTVALRRTLAALLAGLGVVLLLRGDPNTVRIPVVVAGRDLAPGRMLTADDVATVYRESGMLPGGALRDSGQVTGRTLAAPVRGGETITDVRLLGPRLAAASTGDANSRIVPIQLADAGVAELLREGDRVDVVATIDKGGIEEKSGINGRPDSLPRPTILAQNAVVVLVSTPAAGTRGATKDRVVMLAMGAQPATTVAAASLNSALTVIFH